MSEHAQEIPLENAIRVTVDVDRSDLVVSWRDDITSILVWGQEVIVERVGEDLFLRAERRKRGRERRGGGLFENLPNISVPGVTIDWGEGGSSIEVSDEDGVILRTGRPDPSDDASIRIEVPASLIATSIEVEIGDLSITSPAGNVETEVKAGNFRSSGGNANLSTTTNSGEAKIRGLSGSLDLMGGSGNVEIMDSSASVSVKAGSGEVSLANVNGDAIEVMAGSGDLRVRNCVASSFSCHTGSGDIVVTGGELERVTARSGSGDLTSTTVFGPHSQTFMTGSGSVSLGVPRGVAARFDVSTQGGDIDSDFQLVSVGQRGPRSRRTRRQVGSVGSGEPRAEVSVRTSSGDVRLYWLNASTGVPQSAPAEPDSPEPPEAVESPEMAQPSEPDAESPMDPAEAQREVLESLARGEISTDEADLLLQRLENQAQQ